MGLFKKITSSASSEDLKELSSEFFDTMREERSNRMNRKQRRAAAAQQKAKEQPAAEGTMTDIPVAVEEENIEMPSLNGNENNASISAEEGNDMPTSADDKTDNSPFSTEEKEENLPISSLKTEENTSAPMKTDIQKPSKPSATEPKPQQIIQNADKEASALLTSVLQGDSEQPQKLNRKQRRALAAMQRAKEEQERLAKEAEEKGEPPVAANNVSSETKDELSSDGNTTNVPITEVGKGNSIPISKVEKGNEDTVSEVGKENDLLISNAGKTENAPFSTEENGNDEPVSEDGKGTNPPISVQEAPSPVESEIAVEKEMSAEPVEKNVNAIPAVYDEEEELPHDEAAEQAEADELFAKYDAFISGSDDDSAYLEGPITGTSLAAEYMEEEESESYNPEPTYNNISKIKEFNAEKGTMSQDEAEKILREMAISENMERIFYNPLNPAVAALRVFVIGNPGTKKDAFINSYAKLLYGLGKIDKPEPTRVSFGSMPKTISERELYCINDLSAAINRLFNLEDFSDEASQQQHFYHDILVRIIQAPGNSYIILDGTREEYKGFMPLDARLSYLFDKKCEFPDLSNEEIVELIKEKLPSTHISLFTEEFKEETLGYIGRNRRFFPFNNQELASYLAQYATRQPDLKLPKERYNPHSLEETFDNIVGMENVKRQVRELSEYLSVRNKLTDAGAKLPDFNLHMMFLGNPGVGKTSIARVIAKLLFDLGYLREEKIIEVTSKDLIGAYGNQTGLKTNRAIMSALGGVLFVDEAYSLSMNCGQAGAEAIAILIKAMMDYKDDLVVMFAGYTLEMKQFVDSNSGISSRISYIFRFEDYTPSELYDIFILKLKHIGMELDEKAYDKVMLLLTQMSGRRNAGNGRLVDNLIQKALTKHSLIASADDELLTLREESIPDLAELMQTIYQ